MRNKINFIIHHPSILKSILLWKSREEIRSEANRLRKLKYEEEPLKFISSLQKKSHYCITMNDKPNINRLCCREDWDNHEFKKIVDDLQSATNETYIHRKNWKITLGKKNVSRRKHGYIHRKDWEWAMGIIAMKKFNKLNDESIAIGIGAGREEVLFYLSNNLKHVYATDIYDGKEWDNFAPSDFPEDPKKYAPFPYNEDALTVLKMDGTDLQFPDNTFDIAFSFSSIEHFGGRNHSGALKAMKEIERVLKKDGIAVIATEYIINNKDHPEYFNRKTIYSDLIDKLNSLKLVESLDLRITTKTLDTVMDIETDSNWNNTSENFKITHPLILIRNRGILFTSIMLVFQKIPEKY